MMMWARVSRGVGGGGGGGRPRNAEVSVFFFSGGWSWVTDGRRSDLCPDEALSDDQDKTPARRERRKNTAAGLFFLFMWNDSAAFMWAGIV